jgi:hypothetical protein
MTTESVLVGFVVVGLHPTPESRIVKRPAGILNAKRNGIGRNVKNGINKTPTILRPIIFKTNLTPPPLLRPPPQRSRR